MPERHDRPARRIRAADLDPLAGSAPAVGTADPAWLAQLCYCADPRSEHARNVGPCLMVRDGARCGCQHFETPSEAGDPAEAAARGADWLASHATGAPVEIVATSTDPGPPWEWPESPEEQTQRLRTSRYGTADREEAETTRDAEPLADPVVRHLQLMRSLADVHDMLVEVRSSVETASAQSEEWADTIVGELREGLGTGLVDPDSPNGAHLPSTLDALLESSHRVELSTARDISGFILRTLTTVGGICLTIAFLYVLAGLTGLIGVLVP